MFESFRDGLFRFRSKRQMKKRLYNLTAALVCACRDIAKYQNGKDWKEVDQIAWQSLITHYVELGMTYSDTIREQANFNNYFDTEESTK